MTEAQKLSIAIAKLKEWAGECAECGGTGLVTIYNHDGHGSDADDQPCGDCEDIRETIAECSPNNR
jgi:DnaJ-class molecular chaperone